MKNICCSYFLAALLVGAACSSRIDQPGEDGADLETMDQEEEGCSDGLVLCDGACVDVMSDRYNCGECGHPCGSGETCASGACRAECVDECGSPEHVRCAPSLPDSVERCGDHDLDGCLEWGDLSPCPEGHFCLDGACYVDCPDPCGDQGSRRCSEDGLGYETCDDHDDDGCLEWGDMVNCGEQEDCFFGECEYLGPPCGDDTCGEGESCAGCPSDCGDCALVCRGEQWDLAVDFSVTENPSGPWSYGWTGIDGTGFAPGAAFAHGDMQGWSGMLLSNYPYVVQNRSASTIEYGGSTYLPGEVGLHPSSGGERAAVRWVSPEYGMGMIEARFYAKGTGSTDILVTRNSGVLLETEMSDGETVFQQTLEFSRDELTFSVGCGSDGSFAGDATGLSLSITKLSWGIMEDFAAACNPSGAWSFGYADSPGSFTPYSSHGWKEMVMPYWSRSGSIYANDLQSYIWMDIYSGPIVLHPGCFDDEGRCGEELAVVRWTSPIDGEVYLMARTWEVSVGTANFDIVMTSEGETELLGHLDNAFSNRVLEFPVAVSTGDTIDFVAVNASPSGDFPIDIFLSVI